MKTIIIFIISLVFLPNVFAQTSTDLMIKDMRTNHIINLPFLLRE